MPTTTLAVTGMHCGSCGILIDEVLEELDGVAAANTNVKAGRTVIKHDDTLTVPTLIAAVAETGYQASTG